MSIIAEKRKWLNKKTNIENYNFIKNYFINNHLKNQPVCYIKFLYKN